MPSIEVGVGVSTATCWLQKNRQSSGTWCSRRDKGYERSRTTSHRDSDISSPNSQAIRGANPIRRSGDGVGEWQGDGIYRVLDALPVNRPKNWNYWQADGARKKSPVVVGKWRVSKRPKAQPEKVAIRKQVKNGSIQAGDPEDYKPIPWSEAYVLWVHRCSGCSFGRCHTARKQRTSGFTSDSGVGEQRDRVEGNEQARELRSDRKRIAHAKAVKTWKCTGERHRRS